MQCSIMLRSFFPLIRPPHGCLQYHTGDSGSLSTFNYAATSGRHINSHDYSICIRQEEGNHNQVTSFIFKLKLFQT